MRQLRTFLLALSLLPGITTGAESMYVIDKLLVGVHRDRDLNSAIIKVLPPAACCRCWSATTSSRGSRTPKG